MKELTRRGFIARSLITGTGLTLAGRGLQAAPFARVRGANEVIRIGVIGVIVHCEDGHVAQNRAYDKQGALIREFAPTNVDDKTNFIQAVRSRKQSDLYGDILEGHLSAALVHMTNISYRVGQAAPRDHLKDAAQGRPELSDAFDRFGAHLDANEIDLKRTPAVLGASLTMDPQQERFVGAFSERANEYVTRKPRQGFAVPETV